MSKPRISGVKFVKEPINPNPKYWSLKKKRGGSYYLISKIKATKNTKDIKALREYLKTSPTTMRKKARRTVAELDRDKFLGVRYQELFQAPESDD